MLLPLSTVILVIFFIIVGIISFYIGITRPQHNRDANSPHLWNKQVPMLFGISCFLLALFFLLIGIHDVIPEQNTTPRLLVYIIAAIVLAFGVIVCGYMLRYYLLSIKLKK